MKKMIALLMTFTLVFSMMVVPTLAWVGYPQTINGVLTNISLNNPNQTKAVATSSIANGSSRYQYIILHVYGTRNDGVSSRNIGTGEVNTGSSLSVHTNAPYSNFRYAESWHYVVQRNTQRGYLHED